MTKRFRILVLVFTLESFMTNSQNRRPKNNVKSSKMIILAIFGVVAVITAIMAFIFVRNLVSSWTLGTLPGAPNLNGDASAHACIGGKIHPERRIPPTFRRTHASTLEWIKPCDRSGHGFGL